MNAQVQFTVKADRYEARVNDPIIVTFKVIGEAENFEPPSFAGLKIISGPNQESRVMGFGSRSRTVHTISYELVASKKKAYTIGSGKLVANKKTFTTKPFQIKIVEQLSEANRKNDPLYQASKIAFLKVVPSKTKIYQGEPVIVDYKVYFKSQIGRPDLLDEPKFTGFYKDNIELVRLITERVTYKGEKLYSATINRRLLIPQKNGSLSIGPVEMKIPTQIPTSRTNRNGNRINRTINQTARVNFPRIEVKPLPERGKPSYFTGAVGKYSMKVSLSRNELSADESVTLKIKISGNGNIKLVNIPTPDFPTAFEAYDPKYKEKIVSDENGMQGSKTYEYLLIPRYGGTYKIPSIQFAYFDVIKEKYISVNSEDFEITVTGGKPQPTDGQTATGANNPKENVAILNSDILYIKAAPAQLTKAKKGFFGSAWFYLLLTIPIICSLTMFAGLVLKRKEWRDPTKRKQGLANKVASKHLLDAKAHLDSSDKDAFYLALSSALLGYFSSKLNLPNSELSKENIKTSLENLKVDIHLIDNSIDLLNRAEMARFTSASFSLESDYRETAQVITEIENQLR